MDNWLPTFPLLNRAWPARGPVPEDYKDWSVAELFAGRRFAQSEPTAAPERPLSDGARTAPATTAFQPDWLADAQWQAPPERQPAWPKSPEQDPWSRYDGWSIPELMVGHRLPQATDASEAAQALEARNAAAYSQRQSVRPIGGREEGPVTDFVREAANPIPQSPLDVGLLALGGPFKPLVKALVLGASGALESSDAEAGRRPRLPGSAAARRASRLPMDDEARMARAKAMGYRMDMPLGHGTSREFTAFDPSKLGTAMETPTSRRGFWLEIDPQPGGVAERHAKLAAERLGGAPRVMRLVHRSDNPFTYRMRGTESFDDINNVVARAWDEGFDSVTIHNYRHGAKRRSILVVRDPSQLRDPSAVFDPRKRNSRDLFSSVNTAKPALG
jgi:hypothetical protein